MHRWGSTLWILFVILAVSGCGTDGGNGPIDPGDVISDNVQDDAVEELDVDLVDSQVVVETEVSTNEVDVGGEVAITCMVTVDGEPVKLSTEVHIDDGDEEQVVSEGTRTMDTPGEFQVWCSLKSGEARDETPETIVVELTGVVSVETEIEPATVPAGETAVVTCTACDGAGLCSDWKKGIRSDPEEGVAIDGQEITGELVGSYMVECKGPVDAEINQVELTVTPGTPLNFVASVEPEEISVTETAEVSCAVTDGYGNVVENSDWIVQAPDEVNVNGTTLASTVAGEYEITCEPQTATGDEEITDATLTVTGGEAVGMSIYIKPDKEPYAVGEKITVFHKYLDAYGNELEEAPIQPIVVTPEGGMDFADNKDDRLVFLDNGIYNIHVEGAEMAHTADVEVICDSTGPQILITYPPRAFNMAGPTALTVTGSVTDSVSGITTVFVNDQEVSVGADGGFSLDMTVEHGMNLISAVATDGYGNVSKAFRSVFYSTDWILADAAMPLDCLISDSLLGFMSQDFFDDGDHSQPADDIATVAEVLVGNMDLEAFLPEEGLAVGSNCTVVLGSVSYDSPNVTLTSMDETVFLAVVIPNLVVNFDMECCYDVSYIGEYCDPYYGAVYIDEVFAEAYLFISADGTGDIDASLGPITADVVNVEVDIQGLTGDLFDPLVNLMIDTLKDGLIEQVYQQFGEEIPAMVDQLVQDLMEGMVVELPALIGDGPGTELTINIVLRELLFSYAGLSLVGDLAISAPKGVDHDPMGVLLRDDCMGTAPDSFELVPESEVNLAASLDFVNEALFSVWYGGALTLSLPEESLADIDVSQYGIENLALDVDLYYPPILHSCGTGDAIELQLGDAFIHSTFDMMGMHWDIDIFLFMVVDASLSVIEEEGVKKIGLEIGELQVAEIELVRVGDELKGKESMVENLFATVVLPLLTDELLGGLGGIEVPAFDLGGLVDGIPEGISISLDLEKLAVEDGYLSIGGKLK